MTAADVTFMKEGLGRDPDALLAKDRANPVGCCQF